MLWFHGVDICRCGESRGSYAAISTQVYGMSAPGDPSVLPFALAAIIAWCTVTVGWKALPASPGPSHEAECSRELQQVSDLLHELAWWRWLAAWLLLLLGAIVSLALLAAWTAGFCTGSCLCRRPRATREPLHLELPTQPAVPLFVSWPQLPPPEPQLAIGPAPPAGSRRAIAVTGHGVRGVSR